MHKLKRLMKPRNAPSSAAAAQAPSAVPAVPAAAASNVTRVSNVSDANSAAMISEMILIYDGDGTLSGEIVYMTKKFLGLGHCSACEISHGPRTEKPEFTALKTRGWSVPMLNIHRNEMDSDGLRKCATGRIPCLAAKKSDGSYVILCDSKTLDGCHGDVRSFERKVNKAIANLQLQLPPIACARPNNDERDEAVVPQQTQQ